MRAKVTNENVGAALIEINNSMKDMSLLSMNEMETLSNQAWQINNAYYSKIDKLEREKAMLKRQVDIMWHRLEHLLYPALSLSDKLLKVYQELIALKGRLSVIRNSPEAFVNRDAREAALLDVQERLRKIESDNVVDGVFLPGKDSISNSVVPSGQALCFSLMNNCHHDVRIIQDSFSEETKPPSKLEELNHSILNLLAALRSGYEYEPEMLGILMSDLVELENKQVNGVFYDIDGKPAKDQESTKKQIELAHDMLSECLQAMKEDTSHDLSIISDQITRAREQLLEHLGLPEDQIFDVPLALYSTILEPVSSAVDYLENVAENAFLAGKSRIYSLAQSTYGLAAHLFGKREEANADAVAIKAKVNDIISDLKVLRKELNQEILRGDRNTKLEQVKEKVNSHAKNLADIKKQNDAVIKSSKALHATVDQCQALLQTF
jgi:hypothetical protein